MLLGWLLMSLRVVLASELCVVRSEFTVITDPGHSIAGVIEYHGEVRRRPTVVLVSGAGPSNRDYSTAYDVSQPDSARGNGAFHDIAAVLMQLGYGVVRFDEVGTGRSTGSYAAVATTTSLADDVSAIVRAVRLRLDVDPARILLLGHSEGSAIALHVAWKDPMIAGVISLAGPARSGRQIMKDQFGWQVDHDKDLRAFSVDERKRLLESENVEREASDLWYRSFLTYDPLVAARQVRVPTLLIQGLRDWKVAPENVSELAAAMFQLNRDVELAQFSSLGHDLADDASGNPPRLSRAVLIRISQWLRARWPVEFGSCDGITPPNRSQSTRPHRDALECQRRLKLHTSANRNCAPGGGPAQGGV